MIPLEPVPGLSDRARIDSLRRYGRGIGYNADSGELVRVTPAPATDSLVGFSLPRDPYRDPSEQRVDGFYQQLDHKNDPPFRFDWRARPTTGLSYMKHP